MSNKLYSSNVNCLFIALIGLDRYHAGARYPIPNTVGNGYTDTDADTDTGNDVTHSVGHTYITYVVHTISTFQSIMSVCFETYIQYAYAVSSW